MCVSCFISTNTTDVGDRSEGTRFWSVRCRVSPRTEGFDLGGGGPGGTDPEDRAERGSGPGRETVGPRHGPLSPAGGESTRTRPPQTREVWGLESGVPGHPWEGRRGPHEPEVSDELLKSCVCVWVARERPNSVDFFMKQIFFLDF